MIKGVLLSVADVAEGRRRFGAWLRGGHNFPPLNLEAVCLVACYSYDGGPHWGADVRRPSLGSKDETASQELVRAERAPELCGGNFEGNVVASHRLCITQ